MRKNFWGLLTTFYVTCEVVVFHNTIEQFITHIPNMNKNKSLSQMSQHFTSL